jgi:hypothetical protein
VQLVSVRSGSTESVPLAPVPQPALEAIVLMLSFQNPNTGWYRESSQGERWWF